MQNQPTIALAVVPIAVAPRLPVVSHCGSRSRAFSTAAPRIAGIDIRRLKWTAHSPRRPNNRPEEIVIPLRLMPGASAETACALPTARACDHRMVVASTSPGLAREPISRIPPVQVRNSSTVPGRRAENSRRSPILLVHVAGASGLAGRNARAAATAGSVASARNQASFHADHRDLDTNSKSAAARRCFRSSPTPTFGNDFSDCRTERQRERP